MKKQKKSSTLLHSVTYLGIAGIVGHEPEMVGKYNELLKYLGTEEMLIQFERFVDDGDLSSLIMSVEDNLKENGIELPY